MCRFNPRAQTFILLALLLFFPVQPLFADDSEILDLDLAELMQIQITSAGRKQQDISEVPAAIYVIDQQALQRSGVTSIPEALRMVPGLQVARISSSKWAITSRGFNGSFANKLLVQKDGRTLYTPSWSGVYWDIQETMLEDVERIEVIRGPGATLWGANAVNGIINIITKPASDTQGALVSVGTGTHDQGLLSLRYGTELNSDTYGRVYLKRHDQDEFSYLGDGSGARDDWQITTGGFRLDGDVGLEDAWTLQGDAYYAETSQRVDTFWLPNSTVPQQVPDASQPKGFNLLGRWNHENSEKDSWALQAYYDFSQRDDIYIEQTYQILDLDFQRRQAFGTRHDIVWGAGYRLILDRFENTFQISMTPDSQRDSLFSAFLQDEISLVNDRLLLTLGSKVEKNEYTGFEIQPSARLLWNAGKGNSFWAGVSRAVRTPSRVEDSASVITQMLEPFPTVFVPLTINGNPELDSEELWAYEAGFRHRSSDNFGFDIALFYNQYDKLFTYEITTEIQFVNGMQGETYGVEMVFDWKPLEWLTTELSYSYIELDFKTEGPPNATEDINLRVAENSSPQHQASLRTSMELADGLLVNLWGRYVDKVKNASPQTDSSNLAIDDYFSLDMNLCWQASESLQLTIAGQNLLDEKHLEFVSESFTSPIEVERSVYAKLTWTY